MCVHCTCIPNSLFQVNTPIKKAQAKNDVFTVCVCGVCKISTTEIYIKLVVWCYNKPLDWIEKSVYHPLQLH